MRRFKSSGPTTNLIRCLLLLCLGALPLVCQAADSNNNPSPVAYVYTGSSIPHGHFAYNYLTGFAVAADGSAQALPGFPVSGPSRLLTAAAGHIFGAGGPCGQFVATYTAGSNGSLTESSTLNVDDYLPGNNCYQLSIYALNPDREGRFFNIVMSCGSCNSQILPFRIAPDGVLSLSGLVQGGGAKWGGEFIFLPDDRYAYTYPYSAFPSEYKPQANGMLTFVSVLRPPPPPPPGQQQICLSGDMAASVKGYMAMTWWGDQYWCGQYSNGYELGNYTVNAQGQLGLVPGPGIVPAVEEYAMAFDPTGTYLAIAGATNFNDPPEEAGIQVFKLQSDGTLVATGPPVSAPGLRALYSVAWDNSNHVYAVGNSFYEGCNEPCGLYIFNANDGVLTAAPGSPHTVDGVMDLAVSPTQQ